VHATGIPVQAAKHERRRQFNVAERERKSKNKTAAELAHEQRELEVRQRQEVPSQFSLFSTTDTLTYSPLSVTCCGHLT